ncbi:hypothetical protein KPLM21_680036 [Klebsiella pneumoniae]|uniref:hypothetical protein n=1 Tax=Klebsiella pneumoniae TaxID=573 RepID=UPI00052215FE|nr:hypothetical protein [Klebsiella pneumoniae]HDS4904020.1 hypothetical protein [Klebsiella pneumoniae subsp. pneumoniae]MDN4856619.1 hypothetical protein [Klebsiella pneumoniae]CED75948.1 hypothetical protein KPLM21_680036 [Klebsiella pneumoniae]SXG38658.1 Uncharacterised protein [Klebsiella pneumoniae]HBQ3889363.1 hypothetical protein [Klebsiella pneumoniae]
MINFEQHKNIIEEFIEQHYPLAHSLMMDSYKDADVYYSNYQMLLEAMNKLPEHPDFFLEWLLEADAALYINLMELVVITRTINNVFEQVSSGGME